MIERSRVAAADDGFTLIELLVVMLIIGILVAISIPLFLSQRTKGYETSMKSDLEHIETAISTVQVDNPAALSLTGTGQTVSLTSDADNEVVMLSMGNSLNNQTGDLDTGSWCVSLKSTRTIAVWSLRSVNGAQLLVNTTCS